MFPKRSLALILSIFAAHAQDPADAAKAPARGSISGTVTAAGVERPMPDVEIY